MTKKNCEQGDIEKAERETVMGLINDIDALVLVQDNKKHNMAVLRLKNRILKELNTPQEGGME